MTAQPFRVILGLLTTLSGFEALYAALESSVLGAAMLSVVNLGLALVGAYLLTSRIPKRRKAHERTAFVDHPPGSRGCSFFTHQQSAHPDNSGGSLALLLALAALIVPIDQALQIGNFSLKIAPAIQILGRRLILIPADGSPAGYFLWVSCHVVLWRRSHRYSTPIGSAGADDRSFTGGFHRGGTLSVCCHSD